MPPGADTLERAPDRTERAELHRRNRAERMVRARLTKVDDVYVHRSSWHHATASPEPFVAVIARDERARLRARDALSDVAGLTASDWQSSWTRLSLDDWMIRVYPERASDARIA